MPVTAAPGGVMLTKSSQELIKNPAASKEHRTYEIRFLNMDGVNPADVTECVLLDASSTPAGAKRWLLPVNTTIVPGADGAKFTRVTLEPGDAVNATASEANDIFATVQQVFAEPAP